ncbi:hypothetical protein NHX12_024458 [Muraenolepis orangiensis]|uniref:Uncharacterized protein n=1 Tax=Muraenolepis orangiensis TaxID=630683 RepID=A0A9Q0INQ8_9TELE|nr:hypothetical protein NHX12_024458 [Muraenolepis orangiensis]
MDLHCEEVMRRMDLQHGGQEVMRKMDLHNLRPGAGGRSVLRALGSGRSPGKGLLGPAWLLPVRSSLAVFFPQGRGSGSRVEESSGPPGQSADPAESPGPGHRSAPAPLHPPAAEGTGSWISTAPPSGRAFRCC